MAVTLSCRKLTGEFDRKITVTTNDPSNPKVSLSCKGKILEALKLNPKRIHFGNLVPRDTPEMRKKSVITRGSGGPIKPVLAPIDVKGLDAKLHELEPGERYELEVIVRPPFATDMLRHELTLQTGVAEAETVAVSVFARIAPRLAAKPPRITVPMEREPNWARTVQLEWADSGVHKILDAKVNDPDLTVEVIEKGGVHEVVLRVPDDYKPTRGTRNITITTDDSESPSMRIPVTVGRKGGSPHARRANTRPSNIRKGKAGRPVIGKTGAGKTGLKTSQKGTGEKKSAGGKKETKQPQPPEAPATKAD